MVRIPSLTRRDRDEQETEAGRHAAVLDRQNRRDADSEPDRERTALADRTAVVDRPAVVEEPAATPPAGRPRASALATFGLVLGIVAVAAVATGVLALEGVVVGVLALLVAIGGVAATARSYVTGRFAALLGLLLALAAVVVGVLALTEAITWPDADVNQVGRLADWIDAELPWTDRFNGR